ncbi:MAG: hypothetical protein MK102_01800 [Fuerstiella sp.]|nr:hypothetical protein [Fuerstiella sp.]
MEKLQPVIKQIFWVCTGFVIVMAVSGWWIAIGSLEEQISDGRGKLQQNETNSKSGKDTPNSIFTAGARAINEGHQRDFQNAERHLHSRQILYRTYPEKLADELPAFGSNIPETALRNEYRKVYEEHFAEQLQVLNPFIVQDNKGLIAVEVDEITHEDPERWRYVPPTATQIWNAQEDLWLLRSLFESIAAVNRKAGANRLGKAPVRHLMSLELRGGDRKKGRVAQEREEEGREPLTGQAAMMAGPGSGFGAMYAEERAALAGDDGDQWHSSGGLFFVGSFRQDLLTAEFGKTEAVQKGAVRPRRSRRRFRKRQQQPDDDEDEDDEDDADEKEIAYDCGKQNNT